MEVPRHESWQILLLIAAAIGAKVLAMMINYVIEDKVESLGGDLDDGKVATWLHWAKWSFGRINFFMLQNLVGRLFLYSLVWILIKWPFLTQPDPDSSVRLIKIRNGSNFRRSPGTPKSKKQQNRRYFSLRSYPQIVKKSQFFL